MGILGKAKAIRGGWGDLASMLPVWMEPRVFKESATIWMDVQVSPEDVVRVSQERFDPRWQISSETVPSALFDPHRVPYDELWFQPSRTRPVDVARAVYKMSEEALALYVKQSRGTRDTRNWAREELANIRASDWVE